MSTAIDILLIAVGPFLIFGAMILLCEAEKVLLRMSRSQSFVIKASGCVGLGVLVLIVLSMIGGIDE